MDRFDGFIQTIARMQWSDYVDIALVAFLIYLLMPLIRTPSTWRIARSVIAVLAIAWLTDALELYTLSFILNQFLAVGLLAFVVLFQPELRRMLDRLGNVRLRAFFGAEKSAQEMDLVISQTVMACEILSREKVGALIVFSREARLEEYMRTGTRIDGQVSEQLIRNIFFPKASLHDGAMIISNRRIAAAGCILPVSHDPNIPKELGLRHRAAKGISEKADCLAIVVSEETGNISVVSEGKFRLRLDGQQLEQILMDEWSKEDVEG